MKVAKSFALILFALLIVLMLFPQTSNCYISSKGRMSTSYQLFLYSPNQETPYQDVMPLNFSLIWSFDLMLLTGFDLKADYAYSIDNNSFVSIAPNPSPNDDYTGGTSFVYNPSFFNLLNTSNLTDGNHKIVIRAIFYFGKNLFLNDSSTPFIFTVHNSTPAPTPTNSPTQNPTPTSSPANSSPTPSVPEFSWLVLLPLFATMLFVALFLKQYRIKKP